MYNILEVAGDVGGIEWRMALWHRMGVKEQRSGRRIETRGFDVFQCAFVVCACMLCVYMVCTRGVCVHDMWLMFCVGFFDRAR